MAVARPRLHSLPFAAPTRSLVSSWGSSRKSPPNMEVRRVRVNGQPGLITTIEGQIVHVMTLDVADGRIANCFVVRNPDKLARVAMA